MYSWYRQVLLIILLQTACVDSDRDEVEERSYRRLPSWMRGLFHSENEIMRNTALLSGGSSQHRQQVTWINSYNFLSNHQDVDRTITDFMTDNNVRGLGGVEFNSGRLEKGCCSQVSFYSAVESLPNIYNERKKLVHFEREHKYQYIPFSICIKKSAEVPHGHCYQGTTVMYLLAFQSGPGSRIAFDHFKVPTYCACVQY